MSASPEVAPGATLLLPDLRGGGAERVAVRVAEGLADRRVQLLLFEDRRDYATTAPVRALGRPLALAEGGRGQKLLELARAAAALRAERRRRDLGVTVSFLTFPNLLNVLTRPPGGRVVLSEHNDLRHNLRGRSGPAVERAIRWLYPRADRVVAVSEGIRRDLVERLGVPAERVVVVPNPVDLEAVARGAAAPLAPRHAALFDRPTLITAGSLAEQKGQWHLFRVLRALRAEGRSPRLLLLGDGPLRERLDVEARGAGLAVAHVDRGEDATAADVAFLGFVANPHALMARATLFLLPSLWEGFGLVLVEAMRAGVPVLAADCDSGPREILAPSTDPTRRTSVPEVAAHGLLLPAFDGAHLPPMAPPTAVERAWADAIGRLLGDPEERARCVERGRARAEDFAAEGRVRAWAAAIFGEGSP